MMIEHLTSIVAIDRQGAIGCKNRLPWSIKSDMAFFRRTTIGNTVIMGRKTYESIGGGKGLKGRKNLVLSHNSVLFASTEACQVVTSIEETLGVAWSKRSTETFVIGGAATYAEFAPFVDRYLVTIVEHEATDADAFLSRAIMDEFSGWSIEEIGNFPAMTGQDEFPFRIVSFSAPDVLERQEARKAIANQYLDKMLNQKNPKTKHRRPPQPSVQAAFSF